MKTRIYIIALVFISICGLAQPQLGMSTSYTITPAAALSPTPGISYSTSINITCRVVNKSTSTFNGGIISLVRTVTSGSLTTPPSTVYTTSTSVLPGDSLTITFADSVLPAAYKVNGNGNTIVVWPYSPHAMTLDSLPVGPVYVNGTTGIEELDQNKLFIYPNPVSRMLFIRPETGRQYKELVIYDMQLKAIVRRPFEESTDISMLPPGSYIVSVSDREGRIYSSRFVKNN